jgi:hypothetical protein
MRCSTLGARLTTPVINIGLSRVSGTHLVGHVAYAHEPTLSPSGSRQDRLLKANVWVLPPGWEA